MSGSGVEIEFGAVGHVFFIAMTEKADQLSLVSEDALLNDESTYSETTSRQDQLVHHVCCQL